MGLKEVGSLVNVVKVVDLNVLIEGNWFMLVKEVYLI